MEQVLCIFLPTWDVDLLQRRSVRADRRPLRRRALFLVTDQARQRIIARCSRIAQAAGVVPGMTLAEAQALCPAQVAAFNPTSSRHSLQLLAKWCLRFSPTVCIDPTASGRHSDDSPDGLLLDVTGQEHLSGTSHLLLMEISAQLARLGFSCRLAIAPTVGSAWAVAHYAPQPFSVVHDSQVAPALASLPVESLRLPPDTCHRLRQVGVEQVKHLTALPRESLLLRYGKIVLCRLDQALGRVKELIQPIHPTPVETVSRVFDGAAIQIEAIMLTVQDLLGQLCRKLLNEENGVRGLRLELLRIHAPPVTHELIVGRPTRDEKHLWRLLQPRVERMHLGYGVEAVRLTAHWTEAIHHRQLGAWETGEGEAHDAAFDALLDTLIGRWGAGRILAAQAVASHTPETARQFRPVRDVTTMDGAALALVDRPTVLFERPEAAEAIALQPDCPPSFLRWRGEEFHVQFGRGPERIVTPWWGSQKPATRDYFKLQITGGSWLWAFREWESNRWFVHGLWA